MSNPKDIVQRLRDENTWLEPEHVLAAADLIEALEAEVTELTERLQAVSLYAEEKTECCGFPEINMDGYSACCGMFIKSSGKETL